MYTRMAAQGMPSPNEAEFRAYQLLLSMGQHGSYGYSSTGFYASLKVPASIDMAVICACLYACKAWIAAGTSQVYAPVPREEHECHEDNQADHKPAARLRVPLVRSRSGMQIDQTSVWVAAEAQSAH